MEREKIKKERAGREIESKRLENRMETGEKWRKKTRKMGGAKGKE